MILAILAMPFVHRLFGAPPVAPTAETSPPLDGFQIGSTSAAIDDAGEYETGRVVMRSLGVVIDPSWSISPGSVPADEPGALNGGVTCLSSASALSPQVGRTMREVETRSWCKVYMVRSVGER